MNEFRYTKTIDIEEALDWTLTGVSLEQALIDVAEQSAGQNYPNFWEVEVDSTTVKVEGSNFVITFEWSE